jgi:plasmid stabilization system protein ParE
MARKIVWSANAHRERLEILAYWRERNGSDRYGEKLDAKFRAALRLIAVHPKLGRTTSDPTVRVKSVGEHQLFYAPTDPEIHVLSIWHGRRDPTARPF